MKMDLKLVGTLWATVLVSGCTTSYGWSVSVIWQEPGLYGAFPDPGKHGSLEVTVGLPGEGLPFESARLDRRWGAGQYALGRVSWMSPWLDNESYEGLYLSGLPDARGTGFGIQTRVVESASLVELRSQFLSFAKNVTSANESQVEGWADTFMASRELFGYGDPPVRDPNDSGDEKTVWSYDHWVSVGGPFRVRELFDELDQSGNLQDRGGDFVAMLPLDEWRFSFGLGRKLAQGTNPETGGSVSLSVDPGDGAKFEHFGRDDLSEDEATALLGRVFGELALPPPHLDRPFDHRNIHGD